MVGGSVMAVLVQCLAVCILYISAVSAGPVVVTTILNDDVFQTGVSEYGMYPSVQSLNITCDVSSLPLAGQVELIQLGYNEPRLVQIIDVPAGPAFQLLITYRLPTDLPARSSIACSLIVYQPASLTRGSLDYIVEDSVQLDVWPEGEKSRCISNIGLSGSSRESALITCIRTALPGDAIDFGWRGMSGQRKMQVEGRAVVRSRVNLAGGFLDDLVCRDPVLNEEVCRLPSIAVTDDPSISISPADGFLSDTEDIEFTCASDPPGRVRWVAFGDHGNVLADSLEAVIVPESELGIFITTDSYSSRLRIAGVTVPFSNIHTVMCTTADRGFFRAAVSKKARTDAVTETATTKAGTSPVRAGGDVDAVLGGDVSPVYIIVIVILVLIVIGLIVVCILLYVRAKRAISETVRPGNGGPYAAYHPAASGSPTYMDVHAPRAAIAENDYTKTDGHGYEVPKT